VYSNAVCTRVLHDSGNQGGQNSSIQKIGKNVFARRFVVCLFVVFLKRNALESSFQELFNALRIVKIRSQTTKRRAKTSVSIFCVGNPGQVQRGEMQNC